LLAYGGPVGEEGLFLGVQPYITGKARGMLGVPDPGRVTQTPGSGAAFSLSSWSPDDSHLAFVAGDDGGGHDIWVVGTDGTDEHRISHSPTDDAWPAWSPDGSAIAYQHAVGDLADWRILVTDPLGSDTRTIEDQPILADAPMTWSPDGQYVIGFGPSDDGKRATTMMLFDAMGERPPITIQVDSPFWSSSWQRLGG
jgi:TolB protein